MTKPDHHGPEYVNADERPWETRRFPGQHSKMIFHPRPERPTEPNAGFVRYEPGAHHPTHRHDFAQIWHILEGEFLIGGKTYGQMLIRMPDDEGTSRKLADFLTQENIAFKEVNIK